VKRRIVKITDLADTIGCLLMPKLRYLWRFECGHTELRTHCTVSGNGARTSGRYRYYGICKQCSCPKEVCRAYHC
jgi:hypothetical protein